jgi:NAD(P)-dependent dehydrogenase (short-subunit alcohol dehydrogenase family)
MFTTAKAKFPEFEERGAIITGAASGMGRAEALLMAEAGVHLALVDLDQSALTRVSEDIQAMGGPQPLVVPADISQQDQVQDMGTKARSFLPSVDYLVTCAGVMIPHAFTDISPDEWGRVVDINLTGSYLCCREVVPAMLEQGSGAVVLVASMAGRSTSVWGGAHYTASKHGVIGLARHLARETGPQGIRVNAFCPGGTLTPMVLNDTTPEARAEVAAKRPLRRWATAEEQAGVIAFLLSNQASFITGAAIDSNGGALMV